MVIPYSRLSALQEVILHENPGVSLPRLPNIPKKSKLQAAATEMQLYLSNLLTLRNNTLIGLMFQESQGMTADMALTWDVLQMVLRGYGVHNPLGQKEGGIRVKLVTEEVEDRWGYLKEESRIALQNGCCADCGVQIGAKSE